MKYSIIASFFIASVIAVPLDSVIPKDVAVRTLNPDSTPIAKRDPDWNTWAKICLSVTPNDQMPTVADATRLADLMDSWGQRNITLKRPQFSNAQAYTNIERTGGAEFNIYFSTGKTQDMSKVIQIKQPAATLGRYLRVLIRYCQINGRVQAHMDIPNCPNAELQYIISDVGIDQEGGASIEIMPNHFRG
ncbi:hypothetical protein K505DRAFT_362565 [Melanomma pulvis-pyrius CBS 109.77]|uniref:Uncharacterized protein n=1 Tax=Melanomma pulvis-pyrius CBS 109.77 TaxID=1314802 RepID=A0A6A6X8U2_9PLEO|nr:hypothetical protein K505DRAFT_362565 [Melanomma pulvis-pyrius CBS 109.77]